MLSHSSFRLLILKVMTRFNVWNSMVQCTCMFLQTVSSWNKAGKTNKIKGNLLQLSYDLGVFFTCYYLFHGWWHLLSLKSRKKKKKNKIKLKSLQSTLHKQMPLRRHVNTSVNSQHFSEHFSQHCTNRCLYEDKLTLQSTVNTSVNTAQTDAFMKTS